MHGIEEHQREHWEVHKRETLVCALVGRRCQLISLQKLYFLTGSRNNSTVAVRFISGGRWTCLSQLVSCQGLIDQSYSLALANLASHNWPDMPLIGDTVSTRCNACQAKFVHAAAYYPCGQSPPRTQNWVGAKRLWGVEAVACKVCSHYLGCVLQRSI